MEKKAPKKLLGE